MINKFIKLLSLILPFLSQGVVAEIMDKSKFQEYVFEYLNKSHKNHDFTKSVEIEVIILGDIEIGLQNLYNSYIQNGASNEELGELLKEHFDGLLSHLNDIKEPVMIEWNVAKSKVRPQFAPVEYLDKVNLAHMKLDSSIIIAFVVDDESGYEFVTNDDLKTWEITLESLSHIALSNLDGASRKIPMQVSLEKEKFIGVQVMDGYDAARILIPEFRKFVIDKLGEPFYAAIPNRDFLIMWSSENSEGFKSFAVDKVKKDFGEQPYPLTLSIFKVTKNNIQIAN